jgi:hypothetical protein
VGSDSGWRTVSVWAASVRVDCDVSEVEIV